jgi:hypothetical protein
VLYEAASAMLARSKGDERSKQREARVDAS